MLKVLVVEDQPAVCTALELLFELNSLPAMVAHDPEKALSLIASEDIGAVVQDMNFRRDATDGEEGTRLLRAIKKLDPDLPVLDHDRVHFARSGGTAHQGGRQRLHRQALGRRQARQHREESRSHARALAREHAPARAGIARPARARRELRHLWPGLRQSADARGRQLGGQGGSLRRCRFWSAAPTARAKSGSRRSSRPTRGGATSLSCRSTRAGCPTSFSRPSSSAPKPARTPEPRSYASVGSKKPTAERSSSTRSATCRPTGR